MTHTHLALELADTLDEAQRGRLIRQHAGLSDALLSRLLKDICLESWTNDPARAVRAAESLALLSKIAPLPENIALAAWTDGIAAMIHGQLRRAVVRFDHAHKKFLDLEQDHAAASTQVAKLYPLAMLGRYDEAIESGLRARQTFFDCSDFAAAGRIEHNLGNIFQLSERYEKAEEFLRLARDRFVEPRDPKTLAQITNSLAYVLSFRYKFSEAEQLYAEAFELAEESGLVVTKAEIESNLGYFSLFQGRYDRALELLERARASYATLGMPHQSATAELEMADAYLELNLYAEAAPIYERVIPVFAQTGMSIEHARALANLARARFVSGERREAYSLMTDARRIFASCRSAVGEANVLLGEAQFLFAESRFQETIDVLREAELPLTIAGIKGAELSADFLRAESWRMMGNLSDARTLLEEVLTESGANQSPHLSARCLTALGLTARASNDSAKAETYFKDAVSAVENLRAPLPTEDFRTAFFGDKLKPYGELVRICLAAEDRVVEAFEHVEKSRSRTLIEMIRKSRPEPGICPDVGDLQQNITDLRGQLNWLYNQINQPTLKNAGQNPREIETLHEDAREREIQIAELYRQLQLRSPQVPSANDTPIDIAGLQRSLGDETVLVEFADIDGEFFAFVLTSDELQVFPRLCYETQIEELLSQLYFQVEALRNNPRAIEAHFYELTLRTRRILSELYDLLILPLEKLVGLRRLVVAPHRSLHYVPFHALYDGFAYVVENREVVYTPSAGVLQSCLEKPISNRKNALFVGVSDERIPLVNREIKELSGLFPGASLSNGDATLSAIAEHSVGKEILHLACHGRFRADNPLFSSLRLADSWLTVRDLYSLKIDADLVVLSACETGLSRIAPGDEMLGLARGFFSTGASSLVLSLWNVHDATTVDLMRRFYTAIKDGSSPAMSLRRAQCEIQQKNPHPFFWSPFFLIGRW